MDQNVAQAKGQAMVPKLSQNLAGTGRPKKGRQLSMGVIKTEISPDRGRRVGTENSLGNFEGIAGHSHKLTYDFQNLYKSMDTSDKILDDGFITNDNLTKDLLVVDKLENLIRVYKEKSEAGHVSPVMTEFKTVGDIGKKNLGSTHGANLNLYKKHSKKSSNNFGAEPLSGERPIARTREHFKSMNLQEIHDDMELNFETIRDLNNFNQEEKTNFSRKLQENLTAAIDLKSLQHRNPIHANGNTCRNTNSMITHQKNLSLYEIQRNPSLGSCNGPRFDIGVRNQGQNQNQQSTTTKIGQFLAKNIRKQPLLVNPNLGNSEGMPMNSVRNTDDTSAGFINGLTSRVPNNIFIQKIKRKNTKNQENQRLYGCGNGKEVINEEDSALSENNGNGGCDSVNSDTERVLKHYQKQQKNVLSNRIVPKELDFKIHKRSTSYNIPNYFELNMNINGNLNNNYM